MTEWTVTSLCTGIGLLDLGLEWAGMRTVQVCEIDPWCQQVLRERFPDAAVHDDVRTLEPIASTVLCAGFPCQPWSVAGRRKGAADDRHLWPYVSHAIMRARPRYVILENVPGLVTGGGIAEVLGDLSSLGYDAEWTCFSASDLGAHHKRRRWWLVATANADSLRLWDESRGFFGAGWESQALSWADGQAWFAPDADREREPQPQGRVTDERGRPGDGSDASLRGRTFGGGHSLVAN